MNLHFRLLVKVVATLPFALLAMFLQSANSAICGIVNSKKVQAKKLIVCLSLSS
jgi:hypothetical protein